MIRTALRGALFAGAATFTMPATAATAAAPAPEKLAQPDVTDPVDDSDQGNAELTQPTGGDVIVVTARRREERLADVPVAITALSQEALERLQANDLSGIQGAVPNLNLVQGRGSSSSANVFIRGIGQPDALQTFDPAVGIYVDGVYISRIQGALFNLFDVERLEVLRGPQGTLYGKNTVGGAINIVSRRPDLDEVRGEAALTYGSYDQLIGNGYISVPIATDLAAFSLAAIYDARDGLVIDPVTGRDYNDRNTFAARALLRVRPSDRLDLLLSADYTAIDTALTLGSPTAPICQLALGLPAAAADARCLAPNGFFGNRVIAPAPTGPYDFTARTSFMGDEGQELQHWGLSLNASLELNRALTLLSITAYRNLQPEFFIDIDATQAQVGDVFVGVDQEQISQEFQLRLETPQFAGVAGLYYLQEDLASNQVAFANDVFSLAGVLPVNFRRTIADDQTTRSYAAFGQLTWRFADQWALTAGLRYTSETKEYSRTTSTFSNIPAFVGSFTFPNSLVGNPLFAGFDLDGINEVEFDAWTPHINLSYKPHEDSLLWVSASRGFKSGGFNGRANSAAELIQIVDGQRVLATRFEPETVWTYEAGYRTSWNDGLATLSAVAFYSDYQNFQARVGDIDPANPTLGILPVINAGALRIMGLEFEATLRPTENFNIAASIGILDAEYEEFEDTRPAGCNIGGEIVCEPAFAPPVTARIGAEYRIPLGAAGLTLGGEARVVDAHFLSVDNRRPGLFEDGYALVNAYVQYDAPGGRYYLRGGVKNLFDETYKTDAQEFSSVSNIQTVYYGDPQTFSITAGVRF